MGKGTNQTVTNSNSTASSSPDSNAYQAYLRLLGRADQTAGTPYVGYSGEETAPINAQQQAGFGTINQTVANAQPLSADDINRYQDPYTNSVINATQADFDVQNKRADSTTQGNAASQGALGGDRSAVAAALTQEGQARVQAPVIAGLRSAGYQNAVKTAEDQQKFGFQAGMQGGQAQVGAGTLEQNTQQARDTQGRLDYYQQQGYPFQVAQWLASIDTGVGSQMGGTTNSTGTTTKTGPQPNQWAQGVGAGLGIFGLMAARGGRVSGVRAFAEGGGVDDDFNTRLSPAEERAFLEWKARMAPRDSGTDYDLRGAYRANMQPDADTGHWKDTFKKPNHPTFSDESMYAVGPDRDRAGHWNGEDFLPPANKAGGGPSGMPWSGEAQSWIPQVGGISAGKGAPAAAAFPSAGGDEKAPGLTKDQMKGIGSIGKSIFGSDPAYGGGNMFTGEWGGNSNNPLPGLTADDYGAGFDRGGRVKRYALGGGAQWDDDPSFDDRFGAAFPNRTVTGVGASRPAFGAPANDDEVVNPGKGNEFRMLDKPSAEAEPPALEGWRENVNRDRSLGLTAPESDERPVPEEKRPGLPSIITAGRSSAPAEAEEGPSSAMGYADRPRLNRGVAAPAATPEGAPDQSFLSRLGIRVTPELKAGLLQAGLAMMATRHGGPGSFLQSAGEAGMAGVGAYNQTAQNALDQAEKERKEVFDREKFEAPYKYMTASERYNAEHKGEMTDYQKSEEKRHQLDQAIKMRTPIKVGESVSGAPIMALPQIGSNGKVELYPVDSAGNVSKTPIAPGGTIKPSPAATQAAAETWKPNPQAPPGATGSRNEAYLEEMRKEDAGQADAIKKAANYELDPAKYASMRSGQRQRFIDRVMQYDPNYNPQEVGLRYRAQQSFLPGTKNGDTITAFNTAISHLDVLKEMYVALKNGDSQTINRIKNIIQTQMGVPAPNDVAALSSIIGGEVVKATVGAQNALGDREEVRSSISRDLSQMQADSVIDKYQKLMGGQLNARKFAYEQGTGLHNFEERFLQPRSREVLRNVTTGEGGAGKKPTLDEFLAKAKSANPKATDQDLTDYYNKKYGG